MNIDGLKPANVLLVEDNEDDIELTLEALDNSKLQVNIHVVSDGISAMAFLRREGEYADEQRPDLILLDLNLPRMDGREVLTVEGLNRAEGLHPIQQSFAEKHAVQCGFCTPGILMSTKRNEIIEAVAGNLCRCTGYQSIIAGIEDAAARCCKDGKGPNE